MIQVIIITLPMMVCCLMAVELLLSWWHERMPAKLWLTGWAVTATLLYAGHAVFFGGAKELLPVSDTVYVACSLAVYPLYLIYIYRLTEVRLPRPLLWTLVLPVMAGVVVGCLYANMSAAETTVFVDDYLYKNEWNRSESTLVAAQGAVHTLCKAAFAVEVTAVAIIGLFKIRHYNRKVEQLYADTESKALYSIHTILILLLFTSATSFVVNIIGRTWFDDSIWLLSVPSVLFSVLLFVIGWTGLWQHFSIVDIMRDAETIQVAEAGMTVVLTEQQTLKERIVQTMEREQMFRQPDLKLNDLAKHLGTNRTYLLRAMSEELGMTFTEYVNRQRIAYAMRLMEKHPELNKTDIAIQSGYAVLSSFYRNLKLYGEKP